MAILAIFIGIVLFGCEKDENLDKDVVSSKQIPSYKQVVNEFEKCGYSKICQKSFSNEIEKKLVPGYQQYSIYYNKVENTYYIPVQYKSTDVTSLLMATGVCNHIYSETYDKDGNKYITCQGEGNTCHIEISVGSGGTISNVYIVTC